MSDAGARLFEELMRFKPEGQTPNGWAVKAGVSRTIWADLRRHGNPSRRTLEKLLGAAGSSLAEFEALRVGRPTIRPDDSGNGLADPKRGWRTAPLDPIPLFDTRLAGEWSEAGSGVECHSLDRSNIVGSVDRPSALAADRDAYAVTIVGEAMWPRFRAGRRLLVSPAALAAVGDDVLVQLADGGVLIKELVDQSPGEIELRQFNPDVTFRLKASDIEAIEKVVGETI
jgi:phage repressor protein C with HTH and peptisase S24 domain